MPVDPAVPDVEPWISRLAPSRTASPELLQALMLTAATSTDGMVLADAWVAAVEAGDLVAGTMATAKLIQADRPVEALELYLAHENELYLSAGLMWNVACALARIGRYGEASTWFQFSAAASERDPSATQQVARNAVFAKVGVAPPLVTDGSFVPEGDRVVLRDYGRYVELSYPGWRVLTQRPLPPQRQGEGLAVTDDGRLLVCSEGTRQPVYAVRDPLAPPPPTATPSPSPTASPSPISRTGEELPEEGPTPRDPSGFLIGAGLATVALLVLWRALRPR